MWPWAVTTLWIESRCLLEEHVEMTCGSSSQRIFVHSTTTVGACRWNVRVARRRSRAILLGKFSAHQRFKLGSLQWNLFSSISWHSLHAGCKWICVVKTQNWILWVSGSPYIFGFDVFVHRPAYRTVEAVHMFAPDWLHCICSSIKSDLFGFFFLYLHPCSITVRSHCSLVLSDDLGNGFLPHTSWHFHTCFIWPLSEQKLLHCHVTVTAAVIYKAKILIHTWHQNHKHLSQTCLANVTYITWPFLDLQADEDWLTV